MPNWLFLWTQLSRRLWLTAAFFSGLGVVAALLAAQLEAYVPSNYPLKLGSDAVDDILTILASSMLAVTTFSLTTLVTAYTSVVSATSPRAADLLVSDSAVRSALATFVGAFIYAVVGIIALHTGYYGAQGRVILFFVTLVVVALVVIAMLRWIGQLSSLAQTGDVIGRVAAITRSALDTGPTRLGWGDRGAWTAGPTAIVESRCVGYVQNVDLDRLERLAERFGVAVRLDVVPGDFVHAGTPVLQVGREMIDDGCKDALRAAFRIGEQRSFDQDPRYGLIVLGEIAARALSPGVNDPGTARDVLTATVRLLHDWAVERAGREDAGRGGRVSVRPLNARMLVTAALGPIAKDAGDDLSLHKELQAGLRALAHAPDPLLAQAAQRWSREALAEGRRRLTTVIDRRRLAFAASNPPTRLQGR